MSKCKEVTAGKERGLKRDVSTQGQTQKRCPSSPMFVHVLLKAAGHQEKLKLTEHGSNPVMCLAQKFSKQEPAYAAFPLSLSQVQEIISLSYLTDIMWERVLEIGVKKQWTYASFPFLNFKWFIEK